MQQGVMNMDEYIARFDGEIRERILNELMKEE